MASPSECQNFGLLSEKSKSRPIFWGLIKVILRLPKKIQCATVLKCIFQTNCYTMRLNINQAAKSVGVARSTLYRDIRIGKVSVVKDGRGKPYVDLAELERAYGKTTLSDESNSVQTGQTATPKKDKKDSNFERESELLREQIELLQNERDDLRRRLDQESEERRKLTMMLTDMRPKAPQKPVDGLRVRLGRWIAGNS